MEITAEGTSTIDRSRIALLTSREQAKLSAATGRSKEYYERAVKVMPNGVPSSFQSNDPWPVYIERGEGTAVWDVDGNAMEKKCRGARRRTPRRRRCPTIPHVAAPLPAVLL